MCDPQPTPSQSHSCKHGPEIWYIGNPIHEQVHLEADCLKKGSHRDLLAYEKRIFVCLNKDATLVTEFKIINIILDLSF